jgi:small-conductance mechanosensitive channel
MRASSLLVKTCHLKSDVNHISLSALFAAGAVFAVGLGIAMQNVVQNFVAGGIILMEQSVHPGDVLIQDGAIVKVMAIPASEC